MAVRATTSDGRSGTRIPLRTSPGRVLGALALVAVAGAVARATAADPVIGVLLLFTAVVAASLGGTAAGVVAALVAGAVVNVWVLEPVGEPLTTGEDVAALVTFVALGVVVGTLVQRLEDARRRADRREREAQRRLELVDRLLSGSPLQVVASAAAEAMLDLGDLARVEIEGEGLRAVADRDQPVGAPVLLDGPLVVRASPAQGRSVTAEDRELVRSLASVVHAGLAQAAYEQEASEARLEAELSRTRAAFFAAAGHNLRTPLASLVAAVSVLGEEARDQGTALAPEDRAEMLDTVRTELARLARLVDKVLALSRLESGALEPRLAPIDLGGTAQVAVGRLGPLGRRHRFRIDVPAELTGLRLDVTLVEQILLNLLENAVQAAPEGSEVAVEARTDGEEVVLEVVDHGPGVDPEDRQRIFDEHVRGDARTGPEGSGLGLAIVRGLVHAQHGTVSCLPTPGGGTTMSMRFPSTPPSPSRRPGGAPPVEVGRARSGPVATPAPPPPPVAGAPGRAPGDRAVARTTGGPA